VQDEVKDGVQKGLIHATCVNSLKLLKLIKTPKDKFLILNC